MAYVWALLLAVTTVVGWVLNLVALPGNWLIVAAAALYALLLPGESRLSLSWWVVALLVILALVGEVIEFAAGAAGAKRAGGSRRAALLSLAGALVGGVLGAFAGGFIPVPIIGSVIAAVVCAGIGALSGAMLGEHWKGRPLEQSWQVGKAAFWGRLLGTLGKAYVASIMVAAVFVALVL